MMEAEWLASDDPDALLNFLLGKSGGGLLTWLGLRSGRAGVPPRASARKLRLYACACCRRIGHLLVDERSQHALELRERHEEELQSPEILAAATAAAWAAHEELQGRQVQQPISQLMLLQHDRAGQAEVEAARAAALAIAGEVEPTVKAAVKAGLLVAASADDELQRRAAAEMIGAAVRAFLLRDIMGNPFRSLPVEPYWLAWHDATIPRMARTMYDEQCFDDLPLLADALEEAGCEDAEVLAHCRSGVFHVRGCWVVDRLLGKE